MYLQVPISTCVIRTCHGYLNFDRYLTHGSGSPVLYESRKSGFKFGKSVYPRVRIQVKNFPKWVCWQKKTKQKRNLLA